MQYAAASPLAKNRSKRSSSLNRNRKEVDDICKEEEEDAGAATGDEGAEKDEGDSKARAPDNEV